MAYQLNEANKNAMGGSELFAKALHEKCDPELLDKFFFTFSRYRGPDPEKKGRKEIYHLNDLAGDPETHHLANGGWNVFDKLVFVSHWNMQQYVAYFGLPYYKCDVIKNAIEPIPVANKSTDKIKLIYHTTPHRGLNILVPVFIKLCDQFDNIELDVFSSFEIYGWGERDSQYKDIFDQCRNHPKINYHGFQPNDVVRQALSEAHIFAYPSIWTETAPASLVEALSARCICIHPNTGALPEVSANWSIMYQFDSNLRDHADRFYKNLGTAIASLNDVFKNAAQLSNYISRMNVQKLAIDGVHSWKVKAQEWNQFLKGMV